MQPVVPGAVDCSVTIKIVDSTTFEPETGVTSASAGLALWYRVGATGALTAITEADLATVATAHADGGMKHVSDGVYRLDLPDAAVPASEGQVTVVGGAVTGMHVLGAAIVGRVVPLAPTTAGRSLDVSAGGEAGVDWANVGTPGSTVALSATSVGSVTGAAGSVTGAVGSVTGNVGGSVASVAAGGITAASIATGAIDADALAADAVAEIADGVWDEVLSGHATAGTAGAALTAAGAAADPLLNTVPGSYTAGTAGYVLGLINAGRIAVTFSGPVLSAGAMEIVPGDDYHETEGVDAVWTWEDTTASYTSATATFYAERDGSTDFSKALTSIAKSGSTVTARMRLTAAESVLLTSGAPWKWQVRVTFSSGRSVTKLRGLLGVVERIGT